MSLVDLARMLGCFCQMVGGGGLQCQPEVQMLMCFCGREVLRGLHETFLFTFLGNTLQCGCTYYHYLFSIESL